jgi:CubicO group peptidase (beta-lactamase class C family)
MESNSNYWPDKHWQTICPEAVGMDSRLLNEAGFYIHTVAKRINSLLIVRNGYIVTEQYFNGYHNHSYQHICSVTKSFVSALVGLAIDHGYIESPDQPILDIFVETNPRDTHYLMQAVTVRHLLTMTSGLTSRYNRNGNEPLWDRMVQSKNWMKFILSLPVVEERFGKFNYTSMNSHLLSTIISKTTGMSAAEFANKHLFEPLGIDQIDSSNMSEFKTDGTVSCWTADPQGNSNGGFGLCLRPLDLARFGYLYLRKGTWNGKQVLSGKWVLDSVNPEIHQSNYGYQWWLERSAYDGYSAQGYGGQSVFIIPDQDLVVVMTTRDNSRATSGRSPVDILNKYILTSIKK